MGEFDEPLPLQVYTAARKKCENMEKKIHFTFWPLQSQGYVRLSNTHGEIGRQRDMGDIIESPVEHAHGRGVRDVITIGSWYYATELTALGNYGCACSKSHSFEYYRVHQGPYLQDAT